ncbi:hypothetical protein [Spirosoma gilvum]
MATRQIDQPIVLPVRHANYKQVKAFLEWSENSRRFVTANAYPVRQFFNEAGVDVDEWIELAIESWRTNEGRHCSPEIVAEFNANMGAVLSLIKELQENNKTYPCPYAPRKKSRLVKR